MKYFLLGFLTCLCAWSTMVRGQSTKSFSSLDFSEDYGLEASDVYGIDQDENGYIWIGSNSGVYRFDGTHFENFGVDEGIQSRIISRIYCMDGGSVLLIGEQPFAQYIIKDDVVTRFNLFPGYPVRGFRTMMDEHEHLWMFSMVNRELLYYDGDKTHVYKLVHGLTRPYAWHEGSVLLSSFKVGYTVFNNGKFEKHLIKGYPTESLRGIVKDPQGVFWGLGNEYLFVEDENGEWQAVLRHGIAEDAHLTWDSNGHLWICAINNGLYIYERGDKELRRMDHLLGIDNVQVTGLLLDNQDHIWISTAGNGLKCILSTPFVNYSMEDGLVSNYVTSLYKSSTGRVWVGTNSGLNSIKLDSNKQGALGYTINTYENRGYIFDINEMDDGTIMCATSSAKGNRSLEDDSGTEELYFDQCSQLLGLDSGKALFGSWYNIAVMDAKVRLSKPTPKNAWKGSRVNDAQQSSDGVLVLTSSHFLRLRGGAFDTIWTTAKSPDLQLNCLSQSPDESFWVSTSNGVHHLTADGKEVYTKADGLPSNHCLSIAMDKNNTVWIGTDRGLCQLSEAGELRTFTKGNGLPSNHIGQLLYDEVQDRLWIGTAKGVSSILIKDIEGIQRVSFPLRVNGLEVIGDTFFKDPEQVSLRLSQNHIRIHFQALSYTHPGEVLYQYKLADGRSEWEETTVNFAEYFALAPGEYEFFVRSRISGASWGPQASVSFSIVPPFWQRWYFWLAIFLALAAAGYFFTRLRISGIRKVEAQKRKTLSTINQLEQKALHASMNPHFIFNTLNAIQHIMAKHKDAEGIDFVAEFATLVRQNMEAARTRTISLHKEIENLERYLRLETERMAGKMEFEVLTDTESSPHDIDIPSMLIQPFVENAIWHGIAPASWHGKVTVSFRERAGMLEVTIVDNGVGLHFTKSGEGKEGHISRGIELTRERLRIMSDRNSIDISEKTDGDGKPIGTEVRLVFEIS